MRPVLGRPPRRRARRAAAAHGLACTLAGPAHSQLIDIYLPANVPTFDQSRGVTVLSRLRPLYQDEGVRVGGFTLRGGLDERFGYDSNITGTRTGPASPVVQTSPSASAESNWSRNRLGLSVALDRFDYPSAPRQSHSDYTVALGGGWTVLGNSLDVGYSHVHGNEFGSDIGAVAYDAPVPFDVDIARATFAWDQGRVRFAPNLDYRQYRIGDAEIAGQSLTQRYRDRDVLSGGVTTSYLLSEQRSLLLVLQGSGSHYVHPTPGAPSNDSRSVLVLPGIDYQASGPWRLRLLVGGELRTFDAAQYGSRAAPILEGSLIYTPSGRTTVTATVRRAIEDPEAEGTSGFTVTGAGLVVDHELRRNVLLQARADIRTVDYFQGLGRTTGFGFGGGATWLVDKRVSLFATYRFSHQDGAGRNAAFNGVPGPATVLPSFTKNLALVGVRWRL